MDIFWKHEKDKLHAQLLEIRERYYAEMMPILAELNKMERTEEPRMTMAGDILPYL